ncbi:hypothetical protein MMC07_008191 [Pseudocyphellaria aurata]|nr:hypothetical protein [Pseudocyphellaria aurata]
MDPASLAIGVIGVVEPILHLIQKVQNSVDATKNHKKNIEVHCGELIMVNDYMQAILNRSVLSNDEYVQKCMHKVQVAADDVYKAPYKIAYPKRTPEKVGSAVQKVVRKVGERFGARYPKPEEVEKKKLDLKALIERQVDSDFWHKFAYDVSESRELNKCMGQLVNAKIFLAHAVEFVRVDLVTEKDGKLLANQRTIEEVDVEVKATFGQEHGLRVAQVIKDKTPNDNGDVDITQAEYNQLNAEAKVVAEHLHYRHTIYNNKTSDAAFMFNEAIGEKAVGELIDREIHDNEASGYSMMVNYPQTQETFDKIMARASSMKPVNYQTLALAGMVMGAIVVIMLAYLLSPK